MKQKLLLLAFTLASTILFSQSQNMAFEDWKSNDGSQNFFYKNVTKTDGSGNVYVAGATVTGNGTTDILVVKKNSSGVTLWSKQYNGAANFHDFAAGLVVNTSGDVYITGAVTNNTVNFSPDLIAIKYNSAGTQQWIKTYDGGYGGDLGKDLVLDGSNNVYITGLSTNVSGNTDALTIAYNNSGTQLWVNTFDYAGLNDAGVKISIGHGKATVTCPVTISANNYKIATLNYSITTGAQTETVTTGATTTSSLEIVTDMTTDASGNTYICGATQVAGQGYNYYTAKLTSSLTIAWEQTYNTASNLNDQAKGIKVDASGNVYVTGYSTSSTQGKDITTIKYNSSGTQQWVQNINSSTNGNDEAADMEIDNSANIYIAGTIASSINNLDYYAVKYNTSGTKIWEVESDGNHLNDQATNLALDSLNNVIVTGQSETVPNTFVYSTYRYTQKDIITPTDFNGESPANNFMFYANKGQMVDTAHNVVSNIKFYTNNTYPTFYFKDNAQSFVFSKIDTAHVNHKDTLQRIDLTFTNISEIIKTYPVDQQRKGYLNYFLPTAGGGAITGIFGNKRLITPNLYNNIDLMCSSNQNGIKYYFVVKPGGDMRDIKLEFTGATSFSLNSTTNALSINSKIGSITFDKPTAYQLTATNATIAVTSFSPTWSTNGASNKYIFNSGTYTSSLTLIIEVDQGNNTYTSTSSDNIKWSTYMGKSSADMINKIKTDRNNNLFALGQTYSSVFPQGNGITLVYQLNNAGSIDGFISKFNSANELIWSTFVGGTKNDNLNDVAFHSNGDLYCVGNTNSSDLLAVNKLGADNDASFDGPALTSLYDLSGEGYIFQLGQDGLTNPWLRYYGGSNYDGLRACAMGANNSFFITGYSYSTNIPIVHAVSSYTMANVNTGAWAANSDGIIASFNSSSLITWATYLGSTTYTNAAPDDKLNDIVFADGVDGGPPDFYVTGYANGTDYPVLFTTGSSTYTAHNDATSDAVITRFTQGGAMVWSTYIGGNGADEGYALAFGNNKLYMTGYTNSNDFLSINSGSDYYQTRGSNIDAIFLKINASNAITHSTYLGGSNYDLGYDIVYHSATNTAYISGQTDGANFPVPSSNPANTYNQSYAGAIDNFLTALKDSRTTLLWSTYLGGSLDEFYYNIGMGENHQAICIDGNSNLYLGGLTRTSQTQTKPFPLSNGGGSPVFYQPSLDGPMDATITKFDLAPVNIVGIKEHELSSNEVFIYPNPTSHNLFIKLNTKIEKTSYKILDALGQVVYVGSMNSDINVINVEKLSAGFYVIELINNNSKFSAKFIKND